MPLNWTNYLPLGIYTALGPLAWVWASVTIPMERKRMMRQELFDQPLPDPAPLLTVILPARDEEVAIGTCVAALQAQTYPNLQIVCVNHASKDRTGAILDGLAASDSRIKVVHVGPDLPAGWTGKNYAVWQGVQAAAPASPNHYFLFIDADCTLEPKTLSSVMSAAIPKRVDLVSLMPRLQTNNFWERVISPFAGLVSSMLDRGFKEPYAFGWFMLFRRDTYERIGGHKAVGHSIHEDKNLALRVKEFGGRTRVWWGADLAALRLDRSPSEIVQGLARNFYLMAKGKPWRLLLCLAFVLLCCASGYFATLYGLARVCTHVDRFSLGWLVGGLVHLAAMTISMDFIYKHGKTPRWIAIVLPLTLVMTTRLFLQALWMCITGNVSWRGISYTDPRGQKSKLSANGAPGATDPGIS